MVDAPVKVKIIDNLPACKYAHKIFAIENIKFKSFHVCTLHNYLTNSFEFLHARIDNGNTMYRSMYLNVFETVNILKYIFIIIRLKLINNV